MNCFSASASEVNDHPLVPPLESLYRPFTIADTVVHLSKKQRAQIKTWRADFIQEHGNKQPYDVLADDSIPEKFGVFYMVYPGPAYLLWRFAQTCYDMERTLEAHYAFDSFNEWREWLEWDIFEYLTHEKRIVKWRRAFKRFALGEGTKVGGSVVDTRAHMAYLDLATAAGIELDAKDPAVPTGICFYAEQFSAQVFSLPSAYALIPDDLIGCVKERAAIVKNGLTVLAAELTLARKLGSNARPRSIDLASADDESDADSDDVDGEATGNSLKPRRSASSPARPSYSTTFSFLAHRTTVLVTLALAIATSASLTATSLSRPRRPSRTGMSAAIDDNLFSTASRAALSLFFVYLVLLPSLRPSGLHIARPFWFKASLALTMLTSLAAVPVYPFHWQSSTVLGYVAGLAQVVALQQLVQGLARTSRVNEVRHATSWAGNEDEKAAKTDKDTEADAVLEAWKHAGLDV